ncbi:MAG TPA: gamma-glutamyltransferase family protein, partial [Hyphomicrobiaceae bacterium]|nr:gamma-glutamyltransferase family protein [Hyphomicrobiaceae bacterium]
DAAIAVQLVLNLVEPQSSGIGGGAFLLHWHQATATLKTYDGREQAPASAHPGRFIRDGKPIPFRQTVKSGLSIGIPGLVRLMAHAHERHGKLPWAELFRPAIRLSETGFRVSPRLALLLFLQGPENFSPAARTYFFDASGKPRAAGHLLRNPAFAQTLRLIRDNGAKAFYEGTIADAVVAAVRDAPNFAGDITPADLRNYTVKERAPVCISYRTRKICGMGPPSSGAITVAQTMKLLERFDLGNGPRHALRPALMHLIAEAEKLAYADRNRYLADPDFAPIPAGLLDDAYLAMRAKNISPLKATNIRVKPGRPPGLGPQAFGRDATRESVGTSHISIIDADGNAVSMTTTIESAFGSGSWAAGFLLNNELTDFSMRPADKSGRPIANRVEAGKRPRSSMAPTLVFDNRGKLEMVLGSPGGSRIILYVIKALVGMIDWKLDPQAAASMINFGSRGQGFELEFDAALTTDALFAPWLHAPAVWHAIHLRPYGHRIRPDWMTSGLHILMRRNGRIIGAADPRREGIALGD